LAAAHVTGLDNEAQVWFQRVIMTRKVLDIVQHHFKERVPGSSKGHEGRFGETRLGFIHGASGIFGSPLVSLLECGDDLLDAQFVPVLNRFGTDRGVSEGDHEANVSDCFSI
jgi:hypothetical protein